MCMCCGVLQVGPKGKVIGIDHIKELVEDAITNVKKDDPSLISSGRIKLHGWSTHSSLVSCNCFCLFYILFYNVYIF